MEIAQFQRWVDRADRDTQWNLVTTPQLVCHLTEELGELVQCINRIYGDDREKEAHLSNLDRELVDVLWFLVKIANRFNVDLNAAVQGFVERTEAQSAEATAGYGQHLRAGLRTVERELLRAKSEMDLG